MSTRRRDGVGHSARLNPVRLYLTNQARDMTFTVLADPEGVQEEHLHDVSSCSLRPRFSELEVRSVQTVYGGALESRFPGQHIHLDL
jgi:hypothetical protein